MEIQYSSQYNCACVVIDGTETAEAVIELAEREGALYRDGEDECYCIQFPTRPKKLYKRQAVVRSLKHNG